MVKGSVHDCLKGSWSIGEAKGKHPKLVLAKRSPEGSLGQTERTAPLESLKQEIGSELVKLHRALCTLTKKQDNIARQLAMSSQNLNSVPQLIQEKCREVADPLTSTDESGLNEMAEQITEQLSLARNSTAAATPASSTATFANITARPSTDTVRPFGRTPPLFNPPVASADKKTLSECKFALRIGKNATACILEYGLDAVLSNSDNIRSPLLSFN